MSQKSQRKSFSPRNLVSPIATSLVKGSNNMYDGGTDYASCRRLFSSQQSTSMSQESSSQGNAVSQESSSQGNAVSQESSSQGNAVSQESSRQGNAVSQESSSQGNAVDIKECEDSDVRRLLRDIEHDPFCEEAEQTLTPMEASPKKPQRQSFIIPKPCVKAISASQGLGVACGRDLFSSLPCEILENIFCRLPMLDLCQNMKRVCKCWNTIISGDKFLEWKKRYYEVLRGCDYSKESLMVQLYEDGLDLQNQADLLPGMIRHLRNFRMRDLTKMTGCLKKHQKYHWADALLKERLPECVADGMADPFSVMATLVVLAHSIYDILSILECLLGPHSDNTASEIIESLYCIATHLLLYKSMHPKDVFTRLHYRLFYSLYVFENNSIQAGDDHPTYSSTLCIPTPPDQKLYTQEQMHICNHEVKRSEVMKIIAFAGTGKTTTLIRYTQLHSNKNFLLLVFNRGVCDDCKKRFPWNVNCLTFHSLAFRSEVIQPYRSKIVNSSFKPSFIREVIPYRKGIQIYVQAKFVIDTLENYMASSDEYINLSHVPFSRKSPNDGKEIHLETDMREQLMTDAETVWTKAIDLKNRRILLPHDGYLKLYQLSKPVIRGYDVLLIDEAQDITPAIVDILERQRMPKILVGDPHQSIYSFRGAVNAMALINSNTTFYLTQSFRFGENIAFVANTCLEILKKVEKKILVGNCCRDTILGEQKGQLAFIARTNFSLFEEAVKLTRNESIESIAFIGGIDGAKSLDFGMIMAIKLLEDGRRREISDKYKRIRRYKHLHELERYAKDTYDLEMLVKLKIVHAYPDVLELLPKILDKCVGNPEQAEVVLSTAHKAKGLEFSTVKVASDFCDTFGINRGQGPIPVVVDEYNLLYVAVTRAKKSLQMTAPLMRLLRMTGEYFRVPELSSAKCGPKEKCLLTGLAYTPTAITLFRQNVKLANCRRLMAGSYSPQVVSEDMRSLIRLYGAKEDARDNEEQKTLRMAKEPTWEPALTNQYILPDVIMQFFMAD